MESNSDDPFLTHFESLLDEAPISTKKSSVVDFTLPSLGSCQYSSENRPSLPFSTSSIDSLSIKKSLLANIHASGRELTPFQLEFFSLIHHYTDVYYPNRTTTNDIGEQIRFVVCLHLINHVLKSRARILAHNARLKDNPELEYRDQGFSRPKILIIVPFRESVRRLIQCFENLLLSMDIDAIEDPIQMTHRKRFKEEYGNNDELETKIIAGKFQRTSDEYDEIFTGNVDDHFRLGISITRKSLKFFTAIDKSDFLLVSPVGLRTLLEKKRKKRKHRSSDSDSDDDEKQNNTTNDSADFLSSIECIYIDQLDILSMQNFDHLFHIFEHLNSVPQQTSSSMDFSRIRLWSLNGWARFYRQLIIVSAFTSPLFLSFFHRFATNYAGQFLVQPHFPPNGYIRSLSTFHQLFQRIPVCDPSLRFNYFIEHILPRFDSSMYDHTLIYLSSYFDFVRLRNYMRTEKHKQFNYLILSEYSSKKEILLARNIFFHRQIRFLLMTERFHFYHRYRLKGIRHILFYDLPSYGHFYPEIVQFLTLTQTSKTNEEPGTCTALYAKEDALKLAYVLGQTAVTELLNSEKNTHMFANK